MKEDKNVRRDRREIILEILDVLRSSPDGLSFTHLMYKSNLSHDRMNHYLDTLIPGGMVRKEDGYKSKRSRAVETRFFLTDKGAVTLMRLEEDTALLQGWGVIVA